MQLETSRFGRVEVLESDLLTFPLGLIGMQDCQRWVVLADAENEALAWLQSADQHDLAIAVVSPQRFVAGYQVRVSAKDLAVVGIEDAAQAQVLVLLSHAGNGLAVNLKAPLVVNLETRQGRQVVAKDDHALQYQLGTTLPFRRSA